MSGFLDNVLGRTRGNLLLKKEKLPLKTLFNMAVDTPPPLSFAGAVRRGKNIIAEIKRASPSRGRLIKGDVIKDLAGIYRDNGAAAVSLVTEEYYFGGRPDDIRLLKKMVHLPVLRKDFIVDEYQVVESRIFGADAVLLIASLLTSDSLARLLEAAAGLHLDALVEVHCREDLVCALKAGANIIGVNNRNLRTLQVDPASALSLLPVIPETKIRVVESGIRTEKDLRLYNGLDVQAFLIGEALVMSRRPAKTLTAFRKVLETS